jgi:hypothetical protein
MKTQVQRLWPSVAGEIPSIPRPTVQDEHVQPVRQDPYLAPTYGVLRRAVRSLLRGVATALPISAILALPATPSLAQINPLGSNPNYTLTNACKPVENLTVSLKVTQDMMALVTGGYYNVNFPNGGFALQLNAAPPIGTGFQWLQYGIIVEGGQALGFTQYWNPEGINEHNQPAIVNLPSDTIAAGSALTIHLGNDSSGNVNSITYSVTDPTGHQSVLAMPLPLYSNPSYSNNGQPALVPIEAFQVNVVGPIDIENSEFSSGAGDLTYQVSSGSLTVQSSPSQCPSVYESWEQGGTGESANTLYGYITPAGSTLVQPVTTSYAGALSSNMDTADGVLQVYHFSEISNPSNVHLEQLAFNGGWRSTDVNVAANAPVAAIGSALLSYENTIYGAPETFYLVPNASSGEQIEQLWGKSWSPTSLTSVAGAQPAAVGSNLVGYIDNIAGTDNVFYQGTDGRIHVLTWSPGAPWSEDTRVAASSPPAAAFASALTGHMTGSSEELFYIGSNQHVYELWRWSKNFDGWHSTDVTMANGSKPLAAIGSALAGFYDPVAGTDAVFYVGTDQHLHELLFANGDFTAVDVTSESKGPLVGSGSALAAHLNTIAGSEEVFFVTSNQTLEEAWTWSTATPAWGEYNMLQGYAASATPPSPGSPLATDIDTVGGGKTDELYYMGTDGVVHELYFTTSNGQWNAGIP